MPILNEMEVWDKVEAADFPIKVGGVYRWGQTDEHWPLDFIPRADLKEEPRPAKFVGQRQVTAFQVDRSIYDEILLDHAAEFGCEVFEQTKVTQINTEGDRVTSLQIQRKDGSTEEVTAKYFVDASGNSGMLRRKMGVEVDSPT